jgi:hypothetical protein
VVVKGDHVEDEIGEVRFGGSKKGFAASSTVLEV